MRVEVSSSTFWHRDRNAEQRHRLGTESFSQRITAMQTIPHQTGWPSRLIMRLVEP